MLDPFQCLLYCSQHDLKKHDLILAASGSRIYSFNASSGALLSRWPSTTASHTELLYKDVSLAPSTGEYSGHDIQQEEDEPERPEKRRKLSSAGQCSDSTSAEIVVEDGRGRNSRSKGRDPSDPAVIKLVAPSSGRHIVAVTGEDKCLRVLSIREDGSLEQISERHMPKRPCSVVLTSDESTILCADKFGDVYALPLFGKSDPGKLKTADAPEGSIREDQGTPKRPFTPAATSLTVHTKRNQQALKNQQNSSNKTAERKVLGFEHQLLLGHVSLLTDLAYVTLEGPGQSRHRSYILTADRDEHIRVSRGLPQAHIIESYCLGHTEFLSRLCVPSWDQELLISGGGDDYLLVWDWQSGTIRQKLDFKGPVDAFRRDFSANAANRGTIVESNTEGFDNEDALGKVAVSGMWTMQTLNTSEDKANGELIVSCEGIPALFVYSTTTSRSFQFRQHLGLEGNILDVTVLREEQAILYSMDNVHRPLTTNVVADSGVRPAVGSFSYSGEADTWTKAKKLQDTVEGINQCAFSQVLSEERVDSKPAALSELLYGIEHLRKRGQED